MNGTRENQFAELLTEAIHTIKRRTGRPISVIQDELTFAIGREEGNPLEYWRKGHIPTKQSEFVQLTQELVQRGNLNREWLKRFWDCTEFVGFSDIEAELFAGRQLEFEDHDIAGHLFESLHPAGKLLDRDVAAVRDLLAFQHEVRARFGAAEQCQAGLFVGIRKRRRRYLAVIHRAFQNAPLARATGAVAAAVGKQKAGVEGCLQNGGIFGRVKLLATGLDRDSKRHDAPA